MAELSQPRAVFLNPLAAGFEKPNLDGQGDYFKACVDSLGIGDSF